jgi:hypothetical protein
LNGFFDQASLQCITSTLGRFAIGLHRHPSFEFGKSERVQRVHARHIAVAGNDDGRERWRVEQQMSVRCLRDPEVVFVGAQTYRAWVAVNGHASSDVDLETIFVDRRVFLRLAKPEARGYLLQHAEHGAVDFGQPGCELHAFAGVPEQIDVTCCDGVCAERDAGRSLVRAERGGRRR